MGLLNIICCILRTELPRILIDPPSIDDTYTVEVGKSINIDCVRGNVIPPANLSAYTFGPGGERILLASRSKHDLSETYRALSLLFKDKIFARGTRVSIGNAIAIYGK